MIGAPLDRGPSEVLQVPAVPQVSEVPEVSEVPGRPGVPEPRGQAVDLVVTLPELPPSIDAALLGASVVGRHCRVAIGDALVDCRVLSVSVSGADRVALTIRVPDELTDLWRVEPSEGEERS